MSFLPQLPANGPPWLPRFASSIADLFRRVLPSPLKLFSIATADLPPAADYLGGIIHDSTADTLKIALGAGWSSFSLSTHVHAASAITFAPAGSVAATDVQAAIVELDTEKLAASSYTAADVLAKLLTVDGAGSGLDADLLDGMNSAAFAAAAHTHVIADVTGLQAALDAKLDDAQASAYGLTLLDDADAATARGTLGLAIGTNVQAWDADLDSVASSGIASAWTAFTPAVAAHTGTLTSVSAVGAYRQVGKVVFIRMTITITTNGTGSNRLNITSLPVTSANISASASQPLSASEDAVLGISARAIILNNATQAIVTRTDNSYLGGDGYVINISGSYEAA